MNSSNPSASPSYSSGGSSKSPSSAAGAAERVKGAARETLNQIKDASSSALHRAREETGRMANEKKQEAAERVAGYGTAVHDSAKSLEEKDPNIAWFAHRAADRLENVANYLRDHDLQSLRDDVAGIARRHPAAFYGGLFVAGLLVGNVLKASVRGSDERGSPESADGESRRPAGETDAVASPAGGQSEFSAASTSNPGSQITS
jgi:hypothetical protein